jgi:L-lysine exporter family protein LysE/ArgO
MLQFIEGLVLQASLILVLGAQNLFVLESGLKRRKHYFVASICSLCDAILISVGVLGAASLFVQVPALKIFFGVLGVAFLAFYGILKLRENPQTSSHSQAMRNKNPSTKLVLSQTLAFSLLNPHVYLDAIILIGGYSAKFETLSGRALFGLGATSFSVIWFFGLATLSARMSRYLNNPQVMRWIARVSGSVLILLSFKMLKDVASWCIEYWK